MQPRAVQLGDRALAFAATHSAGAGTGDGWGVGCSVGETLGVELGAETGIPVGPVVGDELGSGAFASEMQYSHPLALPQPELPLPFPNAAPAQW